MWEKCNESFPFCDPVSNSLLAPSLVVRLMTDCEVAVYADAGLWLGRRSTSSVVVTSNLTCVVALRVGVLGVIYLRIIDLRVVVLGVVVLRVVVLRVVVLRIVVLRLGRLRRLAGSICKAGRVVNAFKIPFGRMKLCRRMLCLPYSRSLRG